MAGTAPVTLSGARVQASVRPGEGGVVETLLVDGRSALARTPWADAVVAGPDAAPSEAAWVARWRGGWQLCFPTTGQADPDATPAQGFHGVASQSPWEVVAVADGRIDLRWADAQGLAVERTLTLTEDGLEAVTSARNQGPGARTIAVAEHLVLGGELLAPVLTGATLALDVPAGSRLAPLDYDGLSAGPAVEWPGDPAARWPVVDTATPARVVALLAGDEAGAPGAFRMTIRGPHVHASVTWDGLPHALIWEELAMSTEAPWNGEVVALGIEPTSTPHGAGSTVQDGLVLLAPGARLDWRTTLSVRWVAA